MDTGIWRINGSGGTPTKGIIPKYGRKIPYIYNNNRMKKNLFLITTCVSGPIRYLRYVESESFPLPQSSWIHPTLV
jgi:hypothetical protein